MRALQPITKPHLSSATDAELIDLALVGDEIGFSGLLERYQPRLYQAILKLVQCPTATEDIVQESFARAFFHLPSFRRDSSFFTWIFRIALNCRRGTAVSARNTLSIDAPNVSLDVARTNEGESPPAVAERKEDRIQVQNALARLNSEKRKILILREFDGLDYQAIAEILEIEVGTVRSRLSRARAGLKRELKAYYQGSEPSRRRRQTHLPNSAAIVEVRPPLLK